ncbi:MAG: NIPSNAP family protein [Tannerella sp.]|nr:NIPSNAP family protein [Tannerella sp.]
MQRRNFMKVAGALAATPAFALAPAALTPATPAALKKEIYEWRIYTLSGEGAPLDSFFGKVLFPAYHRKNILTGAFKPYHPKDGEKDQRHVLFIYPDIATFHKVKQELWSDKIFRDAAQPYFDATAPAPVYSHFETYLSEAFDRIPVHRKPGNERTLLEIRIYQSPNEEANQRKVKMFNADEIAVFDQVGIHSVLYGKIWAGPLMPALMYLTWYKNEDTRNAAWKQFVEHPDWIRIKSLPEYAYTATNNQSIFLLPMSYSEI